MTKKTHYTVKLRRLDTGDVKARRIIANSETEAKAIAIEKERKGLPVMADRNYARFEVLTCDPAPPTS